MNGLVQFSSQLTFSSTYSLPLFPALLLHFTIWIAHLHLKSGFRNISVLLPAQPITSGDSQSAAAAPEFMMMVASSPFAHFCCCSLFHSSRGTERKGVPRPCSALLMLTDELTAVGWLTLPAGLARKCPAKWAGRNITEAMAEGRGGDF